MIDGLEELVKKTAAPPYMQRTAFMDALEDADPKIHMLIGAAFGLTGEAGEFGELVKKHLFQGHEFDRKKAIKELGDVLWYFGHACIALRVTPSEVLDAVSMKLLERFKEGLFTVNQSRNRKEGDD